MSDTSPISDEAVQAALAEWFAHPERDSPNRMRTALEAARPLTHTAMTRVVVESEGRVLRAEARVRELEDGIRQHRTDIVVPTNYDRLLWTLLDERGFSGQELA